MSLQKCPSQDMQQYLNLDTKLSMIVQLSGSRKYCIPFEKFIEIGRASASSCIRYILQPGSVISYQQANMLPHWDIILANSAVLHSLWKRRQSSFSPSNVCTFYASWVDFFVWAENCQRWVPMATSTQQKKHVRSRNSHVCWVCMCVGEWNRHTMKVWKYPEAPRNFT